MPKQTRGGVAARIVLGSCACLAGAVWLSTTLWPLRPTGAWPLVAELQASAFLGGVVLAVGVTLLLSLHRRFWPAVVLAAIVGLVGVVLCVAVPRVPVPSKSVEERETSATAQEARQDARTVRVMAANTFFQGADDQQLAAVIKRVRPDVVFLSETDQEEASTVAAATGMTSLTPVDPGGSGPPGRKGPAGVATLASPAYLARTGGLAQLVPGVTQFQLPQLTVFPGTVNQVRLVGVHSVAPTGPAREQWLSDIARLRQWVTGHHVDGQGVGGQEPPGKQPLVMAGDFNSTRWHPGFRALLSEAGLHSCTGYLAHRPTWPATSPAFRLDHVLTTGRCLGGGAEQIKGSDHLAVWADVTT
ncbi:endonuclease/exonuclease/phosphatase family protein [Corynebacterium heidelbergense]|uniref:Endonuclease/exonuclease/phosphatase family protein n=1 Tax=Corynebacterium heidelbergense TaxID=2055947 RepID=A0A364VAP1_9CORY|nr:endonuclease/exonuclease/phosphatase family protein [Corynebacterium heidelbergense]RAV33730.1 endonuclease/exonuclease/phosphatase family protein [Corynebacterium heidelbergense]WCZ35806.1 Endonuclease/Exonuclease/phosphatase family protein [Corynebacterium heidelbergense]